MLAQSMARELGPQGVHVAHVVIDGAIDTDFIKGRHPDFDNAKAQDLILNPQAIAANYVMLHRQPKSAWTHELDPVSYTHLDVYKRQLHGGDEKGVNASPPSCDSAPACDIPDDDASRLHSSHRPRHGGQG